SFNIEAYGPDSTMVIDVTRMFTQPFTELGPGTRIPGNLDQNRSWIEKAVPFPDNVNVNSTLTYAQAGGGGRGAVAEEPGGGRGRGGAANPSNTIVFSWSFHRLPDEPLMPRLCDDRVGYFSVTFTDYTDNGDRVRQRCYITRYRLEKKDPNAAISEPVKPIVYYIDPATPKKWIPFFKRAIESWQPAFEAAGFRNAIVAREAPPNDPDWSPEDARYSVVRWLPSTTENASGPHVHDPRSGEILNAHIQFYQNVQNLQNSWYFTQAAAVDPRARKFPLPDTLMGRLLEYVLAHEVGHTLGFQHNMKASSAYPVDSLRSVSFLRQWGHTPTLMDYSRFNYVAQPEDNIPVELLTPGIGPYDRWATMWGYKPVPEAKTPEEERLVLDLWAREQDSKPWLRFSTQGSGGTDPGELTEAVGDADAVKATRYGIQNIKREVAFLIPATLKPTEGYDDLSQLYGRLLGQWRTELNHVVNIIGGANSQEKYGSQQGVRFDPVSRARQKEAVAFLNEQALRTPTFFLVDDILKRIEPSGSVARIVNAQNGILNALLQNARLNRLSEYEHGTAATNSYGILELFRDVRTGLFSELRAPQDIDVYRRALQRAYVENMNQKLNPPAPAAAAPGGGGGGGGGGRGGGAQLDPKLTDIQAAARAELKELDAMIRIVVPNTSGMTRAHLEDLRHRIDEALKGKLGTAPVVTT
ncbi:MAG: zinc-dependent metalloprotease, partial [Longimicrobiales bacterium]